MSLHSYCSNILIESGEDSSYSSILPPRHRSDNALSSSTHLAVGERGNKDLGVSSHIGDSSLVDESSSSYQSINVIISSFESEQKKKSEQYFIKDKTSLSLSETGSSFVERSSGRESITSTQSLTSLSRDSDDSSSTSFTLSREITQSSSTLTLQRIRDENKEEGSSSSFTDTTASSNFVIEEASRGASDVFREKFMTHTNYKLNKDYKGRSISLGDVETISFISGFTKDNISNSCGRLYSKTSDSDSFLFRSHATKVLGSENGSHNVNDDLKERSSTSSIFNAGKAGSSSTLGLVLKSGEDEGHSLGRSSGHQGASFEDSFCVIQDTGGGHEEDAYYDVDSYFDSEIHDGSGRGTEDMTKYDKRHLKPDKMSSARYHGGKYLDDGRRHHSKGTKEIKSRSYDRNWGFKRDGLFEMSSVKYEGESDFGGMRSRSFDTSWGREGDSHFETSIEDSEKSSGHRGIRETRSRSYDLNWGHEEDSRYGASFKGSNRHEGESYFEKNIDSSKGYKGDHYYEKAHKKHSYDSRVQEFIGDRHFEKNRDSSNRGTDYSIKRRSYDNSIIQGFIGDSYFEKRIGDSSGRHKGDSYYKKNRDDNSRDTRHIRSQNYESNQVRDVIRDRNIDSRYEGYKGEKNHDGTRHTRSQSYDSSRIKEFIRDIKPIKNRRSGY